MLKTPSKAPVKPNTPTNSARPSAFILKNGGRAPDYYCRWNKEIEDIVRLQALEVRTYNEKEVVMKKIDLILEGLGEIQKCLHGKS